VALLTVIHAASAAGYVIRMIFHTFQDPVTSMARMRFFQYLPGEVVFDNEPPVLNEWENPLLESEGYRLRT
jgi:hypothetical protein